MRAPQDTSFEDRLGHWIAAQGFWFQLRHSTGKSVVAKMGNRLLHLGIRLLVIVLLVVAGIGIYLVKRVDSRDFREGLHDAAAAALGAESAEVTGFQRERGKAYVHRLTAEGGTNSFFTKIEARGVRYEMGLLDGLMGEWEAGPVTITAARIEAKAGAADEEELAAVSESLFGEHDWFDFPMLEVLDATVLWGYSERTRGMIQGSHLIVQRLADGWRLQFRNGHFTQNWLRRLEIEEMVVNVVPGELIIESARFRREGGNLTLAGRVVSGLRPTLEVKAQFEGMPLRALVPREARAFVEGTISGEAMLTGSTNSQDGVAFDGEIVLGSTDEVVLRDRLPLLQALTVVDIYNSYRKVQLAVGSFRLKTGAGMMSVTDVQLEAPDFLMLNGNLKVRPPTDEEVARALTEDPSGRDSTFLPTMSDDMDEATVGFDDEEETLTLRRAAEASKDDEPGSSSEIKPGFGGLSLMPMSLQEQARHRHARMMRFEGGFLLEIPGDAFERAQALREIHAADSGTGRIPLEVPLAGTLFELTLDQAEDLYVKGKRVD